MASETTSLKANSGKMKMQIQRQYSYTTLARLIGAGGDSKPASPDTPSPNGAVHVKRVVQRLEEIDAESRDLLQTLFSMLEHDSRLERYVRRRIQDPKVSRMWELVEQILSAHDGHIDVDAMLDSNKNRGDDVDDGSEMLLRGLKIDGGDDDTSRIERFKIRTLDTADPDVPLK